MSSGRCSSRKSHPCQLRSLFPAAGDTDSLELPDEMTCSSSRRREVDNTSSTNSNSLSGRSAGSMMSTRSPFSSVRSTCSTISGQSTADTINVSNGGVISLGKASSRNRGTARISRTSSGGVAAPTHTDQSPSTSSAPKWPAERPDTQVNNATVQKRGLKIRPSVSQEPRPLARPRLSTHCPAPQADEPARSHDSSQWQRCRRSTPGGLSSTRRGAVSGLCQDIRRVLTYLEIRNFRSVTDKRKKRWFLWTTYCYPLHCASEENNVDMVRLLLAAGADKTATNSSGQTPLDLVTALQQNPGQESYAEVIKALR